MQIHERIQEEIITLFLASKHRFEYDPSINFIKRHKSNQNISDTKTYFSGCIENGPPWSVWVDVVLFDKETLKKIKEGSLRLNDMICKFRKKAEVEVKPKNRNRHVDIPKWEALNSLTLSNCFQ